MSRNFHFTETHGDLYLHRGFTPLPGTVPQVNDTWGHTVGDNVIRFVASLINKHVAEHHHVARYGGEERVIVMPATSMDTAMAIAEDIRSAMQLTRLRRKSDDSQLGEITVSIGVSEKHRGDSVDSIIDRADAALYRAKTTGRNKVVREGGAGQETAGVSL